MSDNSAMNITEFLEARIAEDEMTARLVADGPGRTEKSGHWPVRIGITGEDATFAHVGTHPVRVLAECAAKRAALALCDDVEAMDWQIANEWGGAIDGTGDEIRKALAAVYKDHPDYKQEWA